MKMQTFWVCKVKECIVFRTFLLRSALVQLRPADITSFGFFTSKNSSKPSAGVEEEQLCFAPLVPTCLLRLLPCPVKKTIHLFPIPTGILLPRLFKPKLINPAISLFAGSLNPTTPIQCLVEPFLDRGVSPYVLQQCAHNPKTHKHLLPHDTKYGLDGWYGVIFFHRAYIHTIRYK